MKNFFVGLLAVTVLALGYVQQRIWLITLGYRVESLSSARDDLLDQYRVLNYNVLTLQSPVILDERLAKRDVQLTPPKAVEILPPRLGTPPPGPVLSALSQSEPFGWKQALRQGTQWFEDGRQAVAEPAREDR